MGNVQETKHREIGVYCRVSTAEQAREGHSLGNQEKLLRDYAARRWPGRPVVVYAEVASARRTARRRYKALMRDVKGQRVGVVAAVEVSRLWRNAADAISEAKRLADAGCELMIWSAGIDTTTAFGKLAFGLFALYAQFESDTTSERVKRAHDVAKRAGKRGPGRRPYGWSIGEDGTMKRCEHEQAGADLAFALRESGLTWAQVATELTTRGYRTVGGEGWDPGGLRLVLQSVRKRRGYEASRGDRGGTEGSAPK